MKQRTGFLKEPLLHFLVIGALLFAAYAWLNRDGNDVGMPQVRIAESDVRWLKETFALERQREPNQEELRALVREFVKEQLLARQAQELGLDKDDIVVRRRLAQKMTFLLQDNSRRAEPSEDDLHRLYEAQRSRTDQARTDQAQGGPRTLFTRPRISFTQIYFSPAKRTDAAADAREALRELSRSDAPAAIDDLGDRLAGKSGFEDADERAVANQLGARFAAKVFALEPGPWQGPIESSQGFHLVRVTGLVPAQLRPFDEVRPQLVELWQEQGQRETEERYFFDLLKKYRVVPDAGVKQLVEPLLAEQNAARKDVAP